MMDVSLPNVRSYRKKYPHWKEHATTIYLNDYRILGTYTTVEQSGRYINVKDILKALGLKNEHIDELFEFIEK